MSYAIVLNRVITSAAVSIIFGSYFWQPVSFVQYLFDILTRTYLHFVAGVMAHESVHGHAGKSRRSNWWWGRIALLPTTVPYVIFRKTHLHHHAATNVPEKDPDEFLNTPRGWEIPLRAWALPYHWVMWLGKHRRFTRAGLAEYALSYLVTLLLYGCIAYFAGLQRLLLGLIPATALHSLLLWYCFAIKTHEGYSTGVPETRSHNYNGRALYWLTFGLSMHQTHHLNPGLPWTRLKHVPQVSCRKPGVRNTGFPSLVEEGWPRHQENGPVPLKGADGVVGSRVFLDGAATPPHLSRGICRNDQPFQGVEFARGWLVGVAARFFRAVLFCRVKMYRWNQERLRRKYCIGADTPVRGYDEVTRASTEMRFKQLGRTAVYAYTSGSTQESKKIAYNWKRLFMTRLVFADAFFRYRAEFPIGSRSFFIFSSTTQDKSLTSLLVPPNPVRLEMLRKANPAVIYATNPSTIAAFLHEVHETQPLPIRELLPNLRAFACWDGGYVSPFIEQIRKYLPLSEYRHLPMYSMSTETIETIPVKRRGRLSFLPIAPGVLYEFIDEARQDLATNLLRPHELIPGRRYAMVVSDNYGLRRYQTEDLFECAGMVDGIPDLRFAQRRNLSYSFTGEKLTADQLKLAYRDVESHFPELREEGFLTCFPSLEPLPCYRLILVRTTGSNASHYPELAPLVEGKLGEFNPEFKSKIESRRLGRMRLEEIPIRDFVQRVRGWESQFKFLPLYPKLWEAL